MKVTCRLTLTFERNLCLLCFSHAVFVRMLTHICLTINLLPRCTGIWIHMFPFYQIISHGNNDLNMFSSIYSLKRPQIPSFYYLPSRCVNFRWEFFLFCFLWLLTSIEDERWVKQSMNQTASFSSAYVDISSQIDIVYTCRGTRGGFVLYHILDIYF